MKVFKMFPVAFALLLVLPAFAQKNPKKEKEFEVHERTRFIRADIKKDKKDSANTIVFEVGNISGGTATIRGEVLPPAELSAVDVLRGGFLQRQRLTKHARGEVIQFTNVVYPFRARFTMLRTTTLNSTEDILDVEFLEPGTWRVNVSLSQ